MRHRKAPGDHPLTRRDRRATHRWEGVISRRGYLKRCRRDGGAGKPQYQAEDLRKYWPKAKKAGAKPPQ